MTPCAHRNRINLNPVVLGSGKPLFAGVSHPLSLKLVDATTMQGGITTWRYVPQPSDGAV